MCLFKKKKSEVILNSTYKKGQKVSFKRRDDIDPGIIYEVRKNNNGEIIYDIQIGGECPAIIKDVNEKDIFPR
ncbi:MAG: hypothetical protein IJK27_03700 [Bacilli bacterium]|nr:hypothetical protein [Bacilli bacterium]